MGAPKRSDGIDDRLLGELITESQDLQSDAMRDSRTTTAALADRRAERGAQPMGSERAVEVTRTRRRLVRDAGIGAGGLVGLGLAAGGLGTALAAIVGRPAAAGENLDVDILNTASSLENLAVATYGVALTLPFIADGNATVKAFAETTQMQHEEHGAAFNAQAEALGGQRQEDPNPVFAQVVEDAKPTLTDPLAVANFAATLEKVATDTYLTNLSLLEDAETRKLMATVMGVEGQHLAILRAVGALLEGGAPQLIAIPTDLAALPAAAGSVAFPEPFEETEPDLIAAPDSGAVR